MKGKLPPHVVSRIRYLKGEEVSARRCGDREAAKNFRDRWEELEKGDPDLIKSIQKPRKRGWKL